jgi:hypothetical protein
VIGLASIPDRDDAGRLANRWRQAVDFDVKEQAERIEAKKTRILEQMRLADAEVASRKRNREDASG